MPANLTPEFIKARQRFREAKTPEGKLASLEEMLQTIPRHKGTDKMQADIKRRIAKLRETQTKGSRGRSTMQDHIPREGAGQVPLIGPPNSGKSTLLAALTHARPDVADYPFSTQSPVPGMMAFEDIAIQLLDLPPITPDYTEPWVYNLIRNGDLTLLVLDATDGELIVDEIEELLQLLEEKHLLLVETTKEGEDERVKEMATRIVLTKIDRVQENDVRALTDTLPFPALPVSTPIGKGLEPLRKEVFEALRIVRIYTKLPGQRPDMTEPYTLPAGSTALDAVARVHRDFVEQLKYVRVWGSGRFDGQQVPSDHPLEDGDIVEIHLR